MYIHIHNVYIYACLCACIFTKVVAQLNILPKLAMHKRWPLLIEVLCMHIVYCTFLAIEIEKWDLTLKFHVAALWATDRRA